MVYAAEPKVTSKSYPFDELEILSSELSNPINNAKERALIMSVMATKNEIDEIS